MISRSHRLSLGGAALAFAAVLAAAPALADDPAPDDRLAKAFQDPPQPARPQVWWHWMSGNVTEEGAKLDLEWMQRVGVGGVHAFAGGGLEPTFVPKPAPFMSDVWRAAYSASVKRARAAGMDVTIAGSPGWSQTGGPWVATADGMKKYVWSTIQVEGGKRLSIKIARPTSATGPFAAVPFPRSPFGATPGALPEAFGSGPVIAFRTPMSEVATVARYTTQGGPLVGLADAPDDLSREVVLPVPATGLAYVDMDFGRPATIGALTIAIDPLPGLEILASDDGRSFRSIKRIEKDGAEIPAAQQTIAFAPTRARVFRIRLDTPPGGRRLLGLPPGFPAPSSPKQFKIRALRLVPGARVDRFEAKAGFQSVADFGATATPAAPPGDAISTGGVIDLTGKLRPDDTLDWTPPPGRWTILRYGWSLTGHRNGPAEPSATGLEVDKLDPAAVKRYIAGLLGQYRDAAGVALGPKGIDSLLTDSWEAGVQNWTPDILAQFRRLRGYDPMPWLPVLAGRVVGDARQSDAFLFDYRQTLKDLVVENHYQVLADAAHAQGMTYYTEVQGDTPRAISDGMTAKARSDIPTAEFWYRPFAADAGQPSLVADLEEAASAAHVYGKPLVAAEALTVAAGEDPWAFSPGMLKPVADEIFARGVNRMLIHDSHMQPFVDKKPGLSLAFFGQFFNRNDTWAEQAKPWTDYLARTSYMLQQGQYVADVGYFYGEEKNLTQIFEHRQNTDVPKGYGFDYINPEALLTKVSVVDGRLTTASGMAYRILYIPPSVTHMTLPALRKLDQLVRDGAIIVAKKPVGGFGMASPDADVVTLADAMWGKSDEPVRTLGRGRIYTGGTLADALTAEHVTPDVQANGADLLSLHRRLSGADVYFVSNRTAAPVTQPITFRVSGMAPEWWSAEDGRTRPLGYTQVDGATSVMVPLEAQGAGFVVFRTPATTPSRTLPAPRIVATQPIEGGWDVRFEAGRGAPVTARFESLTDWSAHSDPGIRYFSGVGTYSKTITVQAGALAKSGSIMLDLGQVDDLAVVSVNGVQVATAWHVPHTVDLSGKLKAGRNRIEVAVVNLWVNRLIGDKQPGAKPITYAPQSPYRADSPLRPSGLIGPVRLVFRK